MDGSATPELLEVAAGAAVFTLIVLLLVLVVLAARRLLLPEGTVRIDVNGQRTIEARLGDKLHTALLDGGIRIATACGGTGTCGMCRLRIVSGGGPVLPVERGRLSGSDVSDGRRLACQVTVREDLVVEVPDEVLGVKRLDCVVRSNESVATFLKELVLELPPDETFEFRAGAFVQITAPPYSARFRDFDVPERFRDVWDRLDLWRYEGSCSEPTTRAYSLASYPGEEGVLLLDIRIATPPPGSPPEVPPGVVSTYLFSLRAGDRVTVEGPYGHFFATSSEREMVFVGGGAGMAPMRSHILDQLVRIGTQRPISFWYGASSRRELLYQDLLERLAGEHANFEYRPVLSDPCPGDGWEGPTGYVHEALGREFLETHPAPEDCEFYLCGPPLMLRAVLALLDRYGVPAENVFYDDFG